MPNRIIREGILSSERVDRLDSAAEVFYRRLMSKVDDYGLYDARPTILRASLFPLRVDRVREADISRWIAECEKAGLIALYYHDGKPYVQILDTRWPVRSEAKYPLPAIANNRKQEPAIASVFVVGDGDGDGDVGEKNERVRKRPRRFDPGGIDLPEWLDRELWQRWCADRAERGKPITERGAQSQISRLDAFRKRGSSPESVIENSIAGGYAGLFEPTRGSGPPVATSARNAEAMRLLGFEEDGPPA